MARYNAEVLEILAPIVKKAGHSWNLGAVKAPSEVGYSVTTIGGMNFKVLGEATVAEYTVQGLVNKEQRKLQTNLEQLILNKAREMYEANPDVFESANQAALFLTGNDEALAAVLEKAPAMMLSINLAYEEFDNISNEESAKLQRLSDAALMYFLSSRSVEDVEFSFDTIPSLTPSVLGKLRDFFASETSPKEAADEGKEVK